MPTQPKRAPNIWPHVADLIHKAEDTRVVALVHGQFEQNEMRDRLHGEGLRYSIEQKPFWISSYVILLTCHAGEVPLAVVDLERRRVLPGKWRHWEPFSFAGQVRKLLGGSDAMVDFLGYMNGKHLDVNAAAAQAAEAHRVATQSS